MKKLNIKKNWNYRIMNKLVKSIEYKSILVSLIHGDITEETSQAIVNAANQSLFHKSGISAAIVKKGGK